MKQLLLISLALGCLMLCPLRANACSCVTPEVPQAFKQANAVFLGEVVEIIEPKDSSESAAISDRFFTIKFKIERSWKGVPFAALEFSVLSAQGHYGCFAFPAVNKGERYLVYADPASDSGNLSVVTNCSRSAIVRLGSNPRLFNWGAIDPRSDIKQLDAITNLALSFDRARSRRRK
jgi:hypothetical protein